jgi:N-acetylglutamate synthase-like GNAT family acetyltransferase
VESLQVLFLDHYFPFSFFPKVPVKIFHPVDEPLNNDAIISAENADIIFSVTNEILDKYKNYKVPKYFINHGVSESFLNNIYQNEKLKSNNLHVGISGNLRRKDIDRDVLLTIVKNHPEIIFDCWGEYQEDSNPTRKEKSETDFFIETLKSISNVRLHGLLNPENLSNAYLNVDAFLICYDVLKDQSKGTNYHKVLEFISTGKIIISNSITTYKDLPNLVQMVESRNNNQQLPELFSTTIEKIDYFNAFHFQKERREFANNNSYKSQLSLIDKALLSLISN